MTDNDYRAAPAQTASLPPVSAAGVPGPRQPVSGEVPVQPVGPPPVWPPRPSPTPRSKHSAVAVAPARSRGAFHPLGWAAALAVVAVAVVAGVLPGRAAWVDAEASVSAADQQTDASAPPALPLPGGSGGGEGAEPSGLPGPAQPQSTDGDLGLAVPISSPACDGTWVVFLGAATDPATYVADLNTLLNSHRGTQYTLTRGGCSSMRQQLPDGRLIYAVYLGPFVDQAAACSARGAIGGDAYVKRMDDVTPPDQPWGC